ncbi:uridine kinase [Motilibacter rhizosphaerae]|uniref:Uridine kinase n=1 Tax=Motilibacter rhizosphaerae TaxID=598652 RepID=A0A4Q7NQR1_9ACTN|nr:(d)CMP kinase [Motilibacter rhizosphaerae]RZS89361.1 uridine kinase [Motilibacter rhizosphaerae]
MRTDPGDLAHRVRAAPARLGGSRLVCVDGPAGSGKTTLAGLLAGALGAPVLHLDDVYAGWAGLDGVAERVAGQVLAPLAEGRPATYATWDWARSRWGGSASLRPGPVLVLEGCGAGDRLLAAHASLLVWVEAPSALRLERGLERDGEALRAEWVRWREVEAAHFSREGTRGRADLLVDGAAPPVTLLAHGASGVE